LQNCVLVCVSCRPRNRIGPGRAGLFSHLGRAGTIFLQCTGPGLIFSACATAGLYFTPQHHHASNLGPFAASSVCHLDVSPPRCFALWMVCHLDVSPLVVLLPGQFAPTQLIRPLTGNIKKLCSVSWSKSQISISSDSLSKSYRILDYDPPYIFILFSPFNTNMSYSAILQSITLSFQSIALSRHQVPNSNGKKCNWLHILPSAISSVKCFWRKSKDVIRLSDNR